MPRSKRNKQVSLTKVKKEGREKKEQLVDDVRQAIEKYANVVLVELENQRNQHLQKVRDHYGKRGRLFVSKNKLVQLALGVSAESELDDNLHRIAQSITGQCALLCTDDKVEDVLAHCKAFSPDDFARCGQTAATTVSLPAGETAFAHLSHSIEAHLRSEFILEFF